MPKTFQNILDFDGVNITTTPNKILDTQASDCNNIDFSIDGMISTTGGYQYVGQTISGYGYDVVKLFNFKKSFGTTKEIIIRVRTTLSGSVLEWFNNYTSFSGEGQWELLNDQYYTSSNFRFAIGNGDNGQNINRLFAGNAVDDIVLWDGSTTRVIGASGSTLTVENDVAGEGFRKDYYTGLGQNGYGYLMINGIKCYFSGISGNTFTGVEATIGGSSHTAEELLTDGRIKLHDGVTTCANNVLTKNIYLTSSQLSFTKNTVTGSYITRADGGNFVTDGYQGGQQISVSGFTNTSNNSVFTINNVDTSIIYLTETVGTTESAGANVTIAVGLPKGNVLCVDNGRLYISGVTGEENTLYYTTVNNLTVSSKVTTSASLSDAGWFTIFQGGSRINAIIPRGNNQVLIHKNDGIFSYNLSVDSNNKAFASLDSLCLGDGVGAINAESIITYKNKYCFINGYNIVNIMSQSIYNTKSFDFSEVTGNLRYLKIKNLKLCYDEYKRRFVISYSNSVNDIDRGTILSIYVKNTANGIVYKSSFSDYSVAAGTGSYYPVSLPLLYVNSGILSLNGVYTGRLSNTIMLNDLCSIDTPKSYIISNEKYFGEIAKDKSFDIINLSGYLYGDTTIRVRIIYGNFGDDNIKNIYITKNTKGVREKENEYLDKNINGQNSIYLNQNLYWLSQSRRFSIPIHVDKTKSTNYKIIIETYIPEGQAQIGIWWAIDGIATDTELNDVDMNRLVNQNDVSGYGVGSMIVGSTNKVE